MRCSKLVLIISLISITASSMLCAAPGDLRKALEAKGIKKIAVIPPMEAGNYVVQFLKKEGLDQMTKVLTPQEFVNADVFNSKNFQLAIYAGYEKYLQTVKDPSDGDSALVNFVAKGGTLLLLGSGPTPLYTNEKNKAADSAGLIGIQIIKGKDDKYGTAMGFEKPQDGAKLSFVTQKDLKPVQNGVPDKFAFPSQGDLRFRPAANRTSSKAYIPLISVTDDKGTWLGDAAAYNSGVVYAWMRLTQPDETNRDKVIGALVLFAANPDLPRVENKAISALEKMRGLAIRFKNIRIAFLPSNDVTPIDGWISKSGIAVDRLEWEDVVDKKKFNAVTYPIVIYAGGEKYKQTVKVYADVDEALIRYMEGGGFLIINSNYPWPLYMNEDNEPTFITGKMGFPICGIDDAGTPSPDPKLVGFEKPRAELNFNFMADKKRFPDIPEKVAFPSGGDMRWRPIVGTNLPKADAYIPIVVLNDEDNNYYGDGIAYVQHKVSQPINGKGLYIWSRAADIFGANDLYYDVFAFVADMKK